MPSSAFFTEWAEQNRTHRSPVERVRRVLVIAPAAG